MCLRVGAPRQECISFHPVFRWVGAPRRLIQKNPKNPKNQKLWFSPWRHPYHGISLGSLGVGAPTGNSKKFQKSQKMENLLLPCGGALTSIYIFYLHLAV